MQKINMNVELLAWIFISSAFIVFACYYFNKWSFSYKRKKENLRTIYKNWADSVGVDYYIFCDIFNLIGEAYKIDPEYLRPSDKIVGLEAIDSWIMDSGLDYLNNGINERFGIVKFESQPETIGELIISLNKYPRI
jgi:lipoprotein